MNTNPQATRILCYGDSITYGRIPNSRARYSSTVRRTWQLQNLLGDNYEIIEEWLRWRTTHLDSPTKEGRNWLDYFYPCILSHYPLDYIIIMLWTNDLQYYFEGNISASAQSFVKYNDIIDQACSEFDMPKPQIILISPPLIDGSYLKEWTIFTSQSQNQSTQFASHYSTIAQQLWRWFIDSAPALWMWVVDGIHISPEQNTQLAQLIYQTIIN